MTSPTEQLCQAADGACKSALIPDYIWEAIIENGSEEERAQAQQYLLLDHEQRNQREVIQSSLPVATLAGAGTPHKNRLVYTAANSTNLPGTLVRQEGGAPSKDVAVNEAYDGLGATFDLFYDIYGRNSIDNNGQNLLATVHYGVKYANAFWNGTQMVFGDGDNTYFNRFTIAIDVIAHELAHGVTGTTAKLVYQNQPGALNESISDVFGSLVKQRKLGQSAAQADWLIGAGLFTAKVKGVALRSMKAPGTAYNDPVLGKDPQPDHFSKYVNTSSDNGGVHINSGIPNKAFYLAAIAIGGNAWEIPGKIWYRTLVDTRLSSSASFLDFATLTVDNAQSLYGSDVQAKVAKAWNDVGIAVAAGPSWQNSKAVLSVYATSDSANAWGYIQDCGWRRIQPVSPNGVTDMFNVLVNAKTFNGKVNVYVDGTYIYQVFGV